MFPRSDIDYRDIWHAR